MLGSRAIYHDGWKAVTFKPLGPLYHPDDDADAPFDEDVWELFHVAEDFSECNDLAAAEPEKLQQMVDLWWKEAERFDVLPLDNKPEFEDDPNAIDIDDITGRVDFNHVSFNYVEDVPVLADIDLHVEPGETIALVGQTGAGKTTITALISRFYDVSSGSIEVDGIDVRKISHASLAHRMGIVLQEPFLFSGTVAENIRYGKPDATDEEVHEAAETVGADAFIMHLEEGYDTYLHERGMNLSVGQRQLISFARAIIARPRILILDEATANVDSQTEAVIQRALKTLLAGRTSFVIAHRLSTIRNADRIIVLEHGRIVEQGKHDDLLALGGRYARLYRMTYEQHALGAASSDGNGAKAKNGHGNGHAPALKPSAEPAG